MSASPAPAAGPAPLILSSDSDGITRLADARYPSVALRYLAVEVAGEPQPPSPLTAAAWHALDAHTWILAVLTTAGALGVFWLRRSGSETLDIVQRAGTSLPGANSNGAGVAFSANGRRLIAVASKAPLGVYEVPALGAAPIPDAAASAPTSDNYGGSGVLVALTTSHEIALPPVGAATDSTFLSLHQLPALPALHNDASGATPVAVGLKRDGMLGIVLSSAAGAVEVRTAEGSAAPAAWNDVLESVAIDALWGVTAGAMPGASGSRRFREHVPAATAGAAAASAEANEAEANKE
jgi:hypothetical protein